MRGLVIASDRLLHRDEVTAITAMSFINRTSSFGSDLVQFGFKCRQAGFEGQHPFHTGEVESLFGELLDTP